MELISRSFLNKLINKQYNNTKVYDKEDIYRLLRINPYKKEGKSLLYKVVDVNNAGIDYQRNLVGFKPIPSFEDKYWINEQGKVINVTTEELCSTYVGIDGYEHIILRYYGKKYRKRVHNLMGKTFLGNPQMINHKNGNKSDNSLKNLERTTNKDNVKHAYDNGYYTSRGGQGTPIICINKETGKVKEFSSMRKAEAFTGVDRHRIKNIINKNNTNYTDWDFKFK